MKGVGTYSQFLVMGKGLLQGGLNRENKVWYEIFKNIFLMRFITRVMR